jgi:hypothetical protein
MISIDPLIVALLDSASAIGEPLERQILDASITGAVLASSGVRAFLTGNLAIAWYTSGEKRAVSMEFYVDSYTRARDALIGSGLFPLENPDRHFPAARTRLPCVLPFYDEWLMSNLRVIDHDLPWGLPLGIMSPEDIIIERLYQNSEEAFEDACLIMRRAGNRLDSGHFQGRLLDLVRNIPIQYLGG